MAQGCAFCGAINNMNKPMGLSESVVSRVPIKRRFHTLSNLHWVGRNVQLTDSERRELIKAIRELNSKKLCHITGDQ